jgi:hypothetical protein
MNQAPELKNSIVTNELTFSCAMEKYPKLFYISDLVSGKIAMKGHVEERTTTVNVSDLLRGDYLLTVICGDEKGDVRFTKSS